MIKKNLLALIISYTFLSISAEAIEQVPFIDFLKWKIGASLVFRNVQNLGEQYEFIYCDRFRIESVTQGTITLLGEILWQCDETLLDGSYQRFVVRKKDNFLIRAEYWANGVITQAIDFVENENEWWGYFSFYGLVKTNMFANIKYEHKTTTLGTYKVFRTYGTLDSAPTGEAGSFFINEPGSPLNAVLLFYCLSTHDCSKNFKELFKVSGF